jgi:hypothetical protein
MKAIDDAQQIQLTNSWKILEAMDSTGRPRDAYAAFVLLAFGRALAQLSDSMHSQARTRHAVFEWALRSARELEQLLS